MVFNYTTADGIKFTVPGGATAYNFSTSRGPGIAMLPKIDKISLVFSPEHEAPSILLGRLIQWYENDKKAKSYRLRPAKAGGYNTSYAWTVTKDRPPVLIQAAPKSKAGDKYKSAYFRLEFNPSKLGHSSLAQMFEKLEMMLGPDFAQKHLQEAAKVTTIHIAADFMNIAVSDLLLERGDSHKTHVYFGKTGRTETFYSGIHQSKKNGSIKLYNKMQEMKDKKAYELNDPFYNPDIPFTRLEVSITCQSVDSCRMRGTERVMGTLPAELAAEYQIALQAGVNTVYRPDEIWSKWGKVVTASGLVST